MNKLKNVFTSTSILAHFDSNKEILVKANASNYVSAEILSQRDDEEILHPMIFFSKKHSSAKCNYEIYDKKLMTIVRCFEQWRAQLEEFYHVNEILSDHKNLEYFMTTKLLSR